MNKEKDTDSIMPFTDGLTAYPSRFVATAAIAIPNTIPIIPPMRQMTMASTTNSILVVTVIYEYIDTGTDSTIIVTSSFVSFLDTLTVILLAPMDSMEDVTLPQMELPTVILQYCDILSSSLPKNRIFVPPNFVNAKILGEKCVNFVIKQ